MKNKIDINSNILVPNFKYIKQNAPITVFIKITSKCMLNCSFCSQGYSKNCEIDVYNLKKILKKLKKNGVLNIFYTGGEPFLYSSFDEILRYGNQLGLCQLVITNGLLLNNKNVLKMLKYISGISISLHGSESTHNSIVNNSNCYKKVVDNIKLINQMYPKINLDICYTANNMNTNNKDLLSVADLCKSLNLKLIVTRTYLIGKANEIYHFDYIDNLISITHALKSKGYNIEIGHCLIKCAVKDKFKYLCSYCTAGINSIAIEINGDVKICANSEQIIDNIYTSSLKKIYCKLYKLLNKRLENMNITCKNCSNFSECIGGCKCEANKKLYENNDLLLNYNINAQWNKIKHYHVKTCIGTIQKISIDKYLVVSYKNIIINKKAYKFLLEFDFGLTLYENINSKKYNEKEELISLLILLYNNNVLKRSD